MDAPVKEIGLHEISLVPHQDVEFKVILDVIPA
jgi:ribosomal protein L9